MKLARYQDNSGSIHVGIVIGDQIVPVPDALDTIAIITDFDQWRARLEGIAAAAEGAVSLASVKLVAPVARPGKIMGLGFNYADHAKEAEGAVDLPTDQLWFSKASTAINGPFGDIALPRVSPTLDYEAELVIVIGRKGRHVSREDAADMIFGFCVGNDVSVREWQFKTSQFILGKSFDTHAPIGPWITTADAVDPTGLNIRLTVNGEVRQESNTKHFVFDCAAMIEHLSKVMTLEPGDLIFTGTPAGVGALMKPPSWLGLGDVVRVEIDELGAIENRVAAE